MRREVWYTQRAWLEREGAPHATRSWGRGRQLLKDLLRQLLAVLLVLVGREARVLLALMLEVQERLAEVVMRLLHQLDDLALLKSRRDRVLPVHFLRQIDRHAVPIRAQLLQRVGHRDLLRARFVDHLQDELAARQRRQVHVDVDGQLARRRRGGVDTEPAVGRAAREVGRGACLLFVRSWRCGAGTWRSSQTPCSEEARRRKEGVRGSSRPRR